MVAEAVTLSAEETPALAALLDAWEAYLDYEALDSLQSLSRTYKAAVARKRSALIEVATDREANVREQRRWQERLRSTFTH